MQCKYSRKRLFERMFFEFTIFIVMFCKTENAGYVYSILILDYRRFQYYTPCATFRALYLLLILHFLRICSFFSSQILLLSPNYLFIYLALTELKFFVAIFLSVSQYVSRVVGYPSFISKILYKSINYRKLKVGSGFRVLFSNGVLRQFYRLHGLKEVGCWKDENVWSY